MISTPISVYDELRSVYLRYFDTAHWLRDPRLMAERRRLLEQPGFLFTDPLLEPVLPYDATIPLADVCSEAGVSARAAELVGKRALPRVHPVRRTGPHPRPSGRRYPPQLLARNSGWSQCHRHLRDRIGQDRELPAARIAASCG